MDVSQLKPILLPAGVTVLIAWRLYARVRRMVGRQRLSAIRPWATMVLFPLLIAFLLLASFSNLYAELALVAGAAIGVALGIYGLRLTKFEVTPEGWFYTPNLHLGIALSTLFIARIGYRAAQLYLAPTAFQEGSAAFARSPLTLIIFGTLAGYYTAYAVGLIRWKRSAKPL